MNNYLYSLLNEPSKQPFLCHPKVAAQLGYEVVQEFNGEKISVTKTMDSKDVVSRLINDKILANMTNVDFSAIDEESQKLTAEDLIEMQKHILLAPKQRDPLVLLIDVDYDIMEYCEKIVKSLPVGCIAFFSKEMNRIEIGAQPLSQLYEFEAEYIICTKNSDFTGLKINGFMEPPTKNLSGIELAFLEPEVNFQDVDIPKNREDRRKQTKNQKNKYTARGELKRRFK
jgi:hypothetical protein